MLVWNGCDICVMVFVNFTHQMASVPKPMAKPKTCDTKHVFVDQAMNKIDAIVLKSWSKASTVTVIVRCQWTIVGSIEETECGGVWMEVDFELPESFGAHTHFVVQNKMGIGPLCNFSTTTGLKYNSNTHSAPTTRKNFFSFYHNLCFVLLVAQYTVTPVRTYAHSHICRKKNARQPCAAWHADTPKNSYTILRISA